MWCFRGPHAVQGAQDREELIEVDRLDQVRVEARFGRSFPIPGPSISGDRNGEVLFVAVRQSSNSSRDFVSVKAGESEIDENRIGREAGDRVQPCRSIERRCAGETGLFQKSRQ